MPGRWRLRFGSKILKPQTSGHEQFVRLLSAHDRELRRYILTLLPDRSAADDVMQETSIALWRKLDEYQDDLPFLNWACRFAYYEVLKHRKRQQVRNRRFCEATFEAIAKERVDEQEHLEARRGALEECLSEISESDRELVGLRYATGATVAELAQEIEQSAKRLYRELERIRRYLLHCVRQRLSTTEDY